MPPRPVNSRLQFPRLPARPHDGAESVYDAFISYSHSADGKLAPALQRGLRGFAKPWYRLRALRVFRDQTSLSASPALWSGVERALAASRFFVLLASPDAAASPWVDREVAYWREHKEMAHFLIALTDGEIVWDTSAGDFAWKETTGVPRSLEGAFADEPLWTDLRFARAEKDVSLRQPAFRNAVGDLAAPIHGRDKDVLIGDDITQHRRTVRIARAAVAILAALVIALTPTSSLASPSARMGARSPPPAWTARCGFGICARTPSAVNLCPAAKAPSSL
jgi:hypothetical protein